ncbi:autoinducer-2 (AI-2) aldolase LsrF [Pontimonas salivibrio]|uniref:Autoinducer-2 (AI-2) aldolase LsrF n=1 Tax=Pontimonas salivibrio TaxID=1159327 RepID=A0A2L2BRA7_9MICO|nr:3-hydroxy-5-phosphonooxypentane-2,4-dione thiolase [Pontimonas salivibrio]AVG24214.1 autoinducer-2 (AI-2) aldolase LsrF [Pontimonas salivibrio]
MPEADDTESRNYFADVPVENHGFHVRGANSLEWGQKNRLGRIFRKESGKTVMFAVDHGYFQGPTTGLERLDLTIPPLLDKADALMATRGAIRTSVDPAMDKAIVLRASGGPSILKELSNEQVAITLDDAIRINASALAVQMFVGGEFETQSIKNLTTLVDEGMRYGIPVMGVVAVGKELVRDARYFRLATRMGAELGAQIIKCYYTEEGFDTVVSTCPVPIVVAGGKKLPELDALIMARRSIDEGAAGVDMGRNIFQSANPRAMITAVSKVVHEGMSAEDAHELFNDLSNQ